MHKPRHLFDASGGGFVYIDIQRNTDRYDAAGRQIGIWRRVAADNALHTLVSHRTSFGPLDRRDVDLENTS